MNTLSFINVGRFMHREIRTLQILLLFLPLPWENTTMKCFYSDNVVHCLQRGEFNCPVEHWWYCELFSMVRKQELIWALQCILIMLWYYDIASCLPYRPSTWWRCRRRRWLVHVMSALTNTLSSRTLCAHRMFGTVVSDTDVTRRQSAPCVTDMIVLDCC